MDSALTKQLLMNTNAESKHTMEQDHSRVSKFIVRSAAATLGTLLLAVAFLMAVPRANAATTVSTADQDFMLAAGQVNLTEMKLGEYTPWRRGAGLRSVLLVARPTRQAKIQPKQNRIKIYL
jgi:hypothetical protein